MFLNNEELIALTGCKRKDAQVRTLRFMQIEHRVRPNGSIAVSRMHVEQSLGVSTLCSEPKQPEVEPDWRVFERC